MGRILTLLTVAAMIGGAILTYDTKHRVEAAGEQVAALRADVARQKSDIALLRAEWSVLTQPGRLQVLTERFKQQLGLVNVNVAQIVGIDEIPLKPMIGDPAVASLKAPPKPGTATAEIKPPMKAAVATSGPAAGTGAPKPASRSIDDIIYGNGSAALKPPAPVGPVFRVTSAQAAPR